MILKKLVTDSELAFTVTLVLGLLFPVNEQQVFVDSNTREAAQALCEDFILTPEALSSTELEKNDIVLDSEKGELKF